ncbi:hypothetical protein GA0070606_5406 [Micromonospora citrea]|uniref:Uncharacterized protein n=1 Tax=Micromonospora citrea TaxID=47855 RepID=A0A1C6VVS7_9ACTN|nr:hypothetical protein [Micromonospora citrea]SCL70458.1 hypothetical protein GA0070606_5406 [Micromonospora citrea]
MEKRVNELATEFGVEAEAADQWGLIAQLARAVVEAERELARHSRELIGATEDAVVTAKAGDLRTSVRGDLLAAVSDKAAAVDGALMKVAERRQALALVAESVKAARPKPAPELAERDEVTWTLGGREHRGKVSQVVDGRAFVVDAENEVTWVLLAAEVTKVPPAKADDHVGCRGFDNQEFYWHCYTHEVYNQSF